MSRIIIVFLFLIISPEIIKSQSINDSIEQNIEIEFEIRSDSMNTYVISDHPAFLGKSAELTYLTKEKLPKGFLFEKSGTVTWKPDTSQFNDLLKSPRIISFYAQSEDEAEKLLGRLVLIGVEEKTVTVPAESHVFEIEETEEKIAEDEEVSLEPLEIILPEESGWNIKSEGETLAFNLNAKGGNGSYRFALVEPQDLMSNLNENGEFEWQPDFDVVTTEETEKNVNIRVKVLDDSGESSITNIPLTISNTNRPPNVGELPTFYVQYEQLNKYSLKKKGIVFDPDGDSTVFKPVLTDLPQGMTINDNGEINWRPSRSQFYAVRSKPLSLRFSAQDYPQGASTSGSLKVRVSQEDLPPQITIIPNKTEFKLDENEELEFNFFITDPNGEENIVAFDYVSGNANITDENLVKISPTQYEFSWTPGYEFIQEKDAEEDFKITFYAIDRESNRAQKQIDVKVVDTENLLEKDRILYDQYRTVLQSSWDMIQQLNDKEKELDEEYDKSKKGKRNRAIITASLGVITGLSPVIFLKDETGQKIVAAIGGTATATLSTLEASGVIGISPAEVMKKLSYVTQKRNDLIVYGNVFASKYALPLERRSSSFQNDLKNLTLQLNLQDVAKLDLDPTWENSKKATDENIKKVYKDFNPDARFSNDYVK